MNHSIPGFNISGDDLDVIVQLDHFFPISVVGVHNHVFIGQGTDDAIVEVCLVDFSVKDMIEKDLLELLNRYLVGMLNAGSSKGLVG